MIHQSHFSFRRPAFIGLILSAFLLAGCAGSGSSRNLPDTGKPDDFRDRMMNTLQAAPNMITAEAFASNPDYQTAYGMARGAAIKAIGIEAKQHMDLLADTLQVLLETGLGHPLDVEQRGLLQVQAVNVEIKDFEVLEQEMITHKNQFHVFVRLGLSVRVLYEQMVDILEDSPEMFRELQRLEVFERLENGQKVMLKKDFIVPTPAGRQSNMDLPGQ
ncbi:hypothetical protein GF324_08810 [bacterium]|nr:hypothetical protein [bacterium]